MQRTVPWEIKVSCLFGGLAAVGWFILAIGLVFAIPFASSADVSWLSIGGGPGQTVGGRVTAIDRTSFSEGKPSVPVHAYHFEYDLKGERRYGTSYAVGKRFEPPQDVQIVLPGGDPDQAVIEGYRRKPLGGAALISLIFPLIGAVFILPGFLKGKKALSLLRDGVLARGTFVGREPTNMKINNRRVYELTFSFKANDGRQYETKSRTHITELLEDDETEPLLYDPLQPSRAVMLDSLPGNVQLTESGGLQPGRSPLLLLICPAIVLLELLFLPGLIS